MQSGTCREGEPIYQAPYPDMVTDIFAALFCGEMVARFITSELQSKMMEEMLLQHLLTVTSMLKELIPLMKQLHTLQILLALSKL